MVVDFARRRTSRDHPVRSTRTWRSIPVLVMCCLPLAGCSLNGTLAPRGRDAQVAAGIWWYMFWLGTAIFVGWLAIFVVAMVRRQPPDADRDSERRLHQRFIVGGGIVLPCLVFATLFVYDLWGVNALPRGGDVVVDATAYQYWWEFGYEQPELVTANELYIPTGTDVEVRLHTEDVIHSFWVPQLSGKRDMIPGRSESWPRSPTRCTPRAARCSYSCGTSAGWHIPRSVAAKLSGRRRSRRT
jgi:cytochrome c oxidase subunit 2